MHIFLSVNECTQTIFRYDYCRCYQVHVLSYIHPILEHHIKSRHPYNIHLRLHISIIQSIFLSYKLVNHQQYLFCYSMITTYCTLPSGVCRVSLLHVIASLQVYRNSLIHKQILFRIQTLFVSFLKIFSRYISKKDKLYTSVLV